MASLFYWFKKFEVKGLHSLFLRLTNRLQSQTNVETFQITCFFFCLFSMSFIVYYVGSQFCFSTMNFHPFYCFNSKTLNVMMLNKRFCFSPNMHSHCWRQTSMKLLGSLEQTKKSIEFGLLAAAWSHVLWWRHFSALLNISEWILYMFINRTPRKKN